MFWHILIPILTCIAGGVGGFFIAASYLKKQFTAMQTDPKQIQMMAQAFGKNLNQKQLNNLTRQMQKQKKPQK
jgi:uncharacterized protein YneF (UPF0154 family)